MLILAPSDQMEYALEESDEMFWQQKEKRCGGDDDIGGIPKPKSKGRQARHVRTPHHGREKEDGGKKTYCCWVKRKRLSIMIALLKKLKAHVRTRCSCVAVSSCAFYSFLYSFCLFFGHVRKHSSVVLFLCDLSLITYSTGHED